MSAALLSGCFTCITYNKAIGSKSDYFSPTAIYKSEADGSLAIQGILVKTGERNGFPTYLIIPQNILVAVHMQTNGDVSFNDISSLSPNLRKELQLRKKLDKDYKKIADIPKNQTGMNVNQRTAINLQAAKWLPFAFVVDAATFPIEIIMLNEMSGLKDLN